MQQAREKWIMHKEFCSENSTKWTTRQTLSKFGNITEITGTVCEAQCMIHRGLFNDTVASVEVIFCWFIIGRLDSLNMKGLEREQSSQICRLSPGVDAKPKYERCTSRIQVRRASISDKLLGGLKMETDFNWYPNWRYSWYSSVSAGEYIWSNPTLKQATTTSFHNLNYTTYIYVILPQVYHQPQNMSYADERASTYKQNTNRASLTSLVCLLLGKISILFIM
jgi:hypothetical protein